MDNISFGIVITTIVILSTTILISVCIGFAMGRATVNKSILPKKKVEDKTDPNFFDLEINA